MKFSDTGLPLKRIGEFFTGAPEPLTLDFCERWIWWWRALPELTKEPSSGEASPLRWFLYALASAGTAKEQQEQLGRWFNYEVEARISGNPEWKPAILAVKLPLPMCPQVDIPEIFTSHSEADAIRMVKEALRAAKGTASGRLVHPERWPDKFRKLELWDRATLLQEPIDHDDLGPVRRLIRYYTAPPV